MLHYVLIVLNFKCLLIIMSIIAEVHAFKCSVRYMCSNKCSIIIIMIIIIIVIIILSLLSLFMFMMLDFINIDTLNLFYLICWISTKWIWRDIIATSFAISWQWNCYNTQIYLRLKLHIQNKHWFYSHIFRSSAGINYFTAQHTTFFLSVRVRVRVRSTYKIACLCYHCHSSTAPSYVADMLQKKPSLTHNTRSSSYTMPSQ